MQVSDFTEDMPGELVLNSDGQMTFLPEPLPPRIAWSDDLISVLSAADRAIGRLAGLGTGPLGRIDLGLLIRPFLSREAVLSSRIEGTVAELSDLFLFDEAQTVEHRVPDVREVANYRRAVEIGLESLKRRPLSCSLIRELHQVLMTGVRGEEKDPGRFRERQVFIGSTLRIEEARFVPPPWQEVTTLMQAFEQYLQAPSSLPALVRLALAHYQFEAIHPFEDGNGRLGRLLITLQLCSEGLLPLPMLYLSAYFERYRAAYYDHLLGISQRAAWEPWITFFLRGVCIEADDAVQRVGRLMSLRREYHAMFQTARASSLTLKLIDALFISPVVTMRRATKVLDITPAAAQAHIDRLIDGGILREMTGQKRNRIYLATGILKTLDEIRPATPVVRDTGGGHNAT
jgi:Fic family protein